MKTKAKNTPTNIYVPRQTTEPTELKSKSTHLYHLNPISPITKYSQKPVLNHWLKNYRKRESPSIRESKSIDIDELSKVETSLQSKLRSIKINNQELNTPNQQIYKKRFIQPYNPQYSPMNDSKTKVKNISTVTPIKVSFQTQINQCDSLLKDLGVRCKQYTEANFPESTKSNLKNGSRYQTTSIQNMRTISRQDEHPSRTRFIPVVQSRAFRPDTRAQHDVEKKKDRRRPYRLGISLGVERRSPDIIPYLREIRAKSKVLYDKIKHFKTQSSLE